MIGKLIWNNHHRLKYNYYLLYKRNKDKYEMSIKLDWRYLIDEQYNKYNGYGDKVIQFV